MLEMRKKEMVRTDKRNSSTANIVVVLVGAMLLAACASSGDGAIKKFLTGENLSNDRPNELDASFFKRAAYCPPVQIRGGTEALTIYERGHDSEPDFVQHQASITRTARECSSTAEGISIKLGIAGRVVAGPKGGPANLAMPVRIVVSKEGGDVLYSELYKMPVTIVPPNLSSDFSQVFQEVSVPVGAQERDLIVYVGFDEGKPG